MTNQELLKDYVVSNDELLKLVFTDVLIAKTFFLELNLDGEKAKHILDCLDKTLENCNNEIKLNKAIRDRL